MADKQRQDGIIDLTTKSASTSPSGLTTNPMTDRIAHASSVPPTPISPFQQLVSKDAAPPEEEMKKEDKPTTFPVVEKRTSFAPKAPQASVVITPIQQLRSPSKPPAPVALPPAVSTPPVPKDTPRPEIQDESAMPKGASPFPEEHDDEPIFDLKDEMVLAYPSTKDNGIDEKPASLVSLPSKVPEKAADPSNHGTPSLPLIDDAVFEARETVMSAVSLKGRGTYEEAKTTDDLPDVGDGGGNDLFLKVESSGGVDISVEMDEAADNAFFGSDADDSAECEEKEDEEELDLSEAEEVPRTGPPALPSERGGDGRKPIIRRRRKQNKEWWARIFNDDYVSTIPKATVRGDQRKVNFIEKSLALASNALVLDLACGNGRHSVGMAKRGYRVVGIDLSLPMLAQAAELAQDERQNINFIHGDMRDLSFDKTFDAVFCMGTSFGYFDDDTNAKVMQGVFRALKPGGSFLIEVANRDHVVGQTPELTWFEGNGSVCMEETSFNFRTSRLVVTRQLIMDGGRQVQNDISIRVYSLHEIEQLLHQTGFELGVVSGHTATPGAFFGPDSVRIFVCAKRPRQIG